MSDWTHPMCQTCWTRREGSRIPVRLRHPVVETCCWCGQPTGSGIYMRVNPADLDRCEGHDEPTFAGDDAEAQ